eukprot:389365-Pelagomonas_calceolata.AAC.2
MRRPPCSQWTRSTSCPPPRRLARTTRCPGGERVLEKMVHSKGKHEVSQVGSECLRKSEGR